MMQEKNGCISGMPNDQSQPNIKPDGDGTLKTDVGAGKSYEVLLPLAAGDCVSFTLKVRCWCRQGNGC